MTPAATQPAVGLTRLEREGGFIWRRQAEAIAEKRGAPSVARRTLSG